MSQSGQPHKKSPGFLKNAALHYWLLAAAVAFISWMLSEWFALFGATITGIWKPLPVVLVVAIFIWVCQLARLPKTGSICLRCKLPPPAIYVMIASGIATFTITLCLNNTMVSSALSAAALAATLTMIGYSLLLPRVLACHAISVASTEHQTAIADAQTKLELEVRPSSLSEIKNSDNSAFVQANSQVLSQIQCEGKGQEISAILQLLALVDIQGAVVSIDAIGCQKTIAKTIVEAKADYVLAVKENQRSLFEALEREFNAMVA